MTSAPETQPASDAVRDKFKQSMRHLAASVALVTTEKDGQRHGMAASSMTSLCMDPPSLLVCVNHDASIHSSLAVGQPIGINILSENHQDLCAAYAGKVDPEKRFEYGDWSAGANGAPLLTDAEAAIECLVTRLIDYGTHTIVLANVVDLEVREEVEPLIYLNGGFVPAK